MGLFDGGIPKGMQMLFVNLIKEAAPQLAESVDGLGAVVRDFKAQLDRVETKLDRLNYLMEQNHVGTEQRIKPARTVNGSGQGDTIDGERKPD